MTQCYVIEKHVDYIVHYLSIMTTIRLLHFN